jgi:hypothetical protein
LPIGTNPLPHVGTNYYCSSCVGKDIFHSGDRCLSCEEYVQNANCEKCDDEG